MPAPHSDTVSEPAKASRSRKRPERTQEKTKAQTPQKTSEKTQLGSPSSTENKGSVCVANMTAIDRDSMISLAAYYRAERRNFEPGRELDDWLNAESEIDAQLMGLVDDDRSLT